MIKMRSIAIQHNMAAMNAGRMLAKKKKDKAESTEMLSTGYQINRAADDAAGLAISQKLRKMIRGLEQGTENAVDGVSWVQIGDGALEEAQAIIHRMTELSVKSANGTNSDSDRAHLDDEFTQCKKELDRISETTKFNGMRIFSKHEPAYYRCEGAREWWPDEMHIVTAGKNDLTFMYSQAEDGPLSELTVTVPPGEYTTRELLDELDTVLTDNAKDGMQFFLEYTDDHMVDATLEGGAYIDRVSGGLSYLLYDMYKGGNVGALIGTTIFTEYPLYIYKGINDRMTFDVEDFEGHTYKVELEIDVDGPQGYKGYTKEEMMEYLDKKLQELHDTKGIPLLKTDHHGSGIKLYSEDAIVTGFKGNMFTIDADTYTSVFYDNVKHGDVKQTNAYFIGPGVLTTDPRDVEHGYMVAPDSVTGNSKGSKRYVITAGVNDTLVLQPNESESPVTLKIDAGNYTATEMADKLNKLLDAQNLGAGDKQGLVVSANTQKISYGGKTFAFEGLTITSNLYGPDSKIGLDEHSSAYDTLFVSRDYNEYGADRFPWSDSRDDKTASWTGSKTVGSVNFTSNNNAFNITYGGTTTTINMGTGSMNLSGIIGKINTEIGKINAFNGKITAVQVGSGQISIRETDTGDKNQYTAIQVSQVGTNQGFDTLFQAYTTSSATKRGNGSVTLPGTPSSGGSMTVYVDGEAYNVPTTGSSNKVEKPNQFSTVSAQGSSSDRNFTASGTGSAPSTKWESGTVKGVTVPVQGSTELAINNGATVLIGPKLRDNMTITKDNNKLYLTLNGVPKSIELDQGGYDKDGIVTQLQQKIDDAFGTGMGGAIVSLEGDQLRLTSRLPKRELGDKTSISCSTETSSFLKDLNTVRNPATVTSNQLLASNIEIGYGPTDGAFKYKYNGEDRTIYLNGGSYTPQGLVNEMNRHLTDGIRASLSNGRLVLTTQETGPQVSLSYDTNSGGALGAIFGNLTGAAPASAILNKDIQDQITIDPGKNIFRINGKRVELTAGTYYSRDSFLNMLNDALNKTAGVNAQAYLSGNKLGFRTTNTGTGARLNISYDTNSDSAMKAIFGSTGVERVTSGGQTTLRVIDANGHTMTNKTIVVHSGDSGGALPANRVAMRNDTVSGYHSPYKSYIQGASLASPVVIDEYNDDLTFIFDDNGTEKKVSFKMAQGSYNLYSDLQQELQNKINGILTPGKVNVTVNANGVRLEATKKGNDYLFEKVSGDFYEQIICGCTERKLDLKPADAKDGTQTITPIYAVGRQDVRTQPVEINTGINDEFIFDFTRPGETKPTEIAVTLDPGKYNGDSLKSHLQEKINDALVKQGLKAGLIRVGVGEVNSHVSGANDANALSLSLDEDIAAPERGGYIIDGIRGNAAFEIFYQTDGKMIPAYIMGTKDIRNGVTIKENETHLAFEVDGVEYEIDLKPGDYAPADLIKELNEKIGATKAEVAANMDPDTGRVKIAHKKVNQHEISWVSGNAKDEVFFEEYGEIDDTVRSIQLSDRHPDHIDLPRSPYSTSLIGVNSLFIAKEKNALKAIDRLSSALRKISELRIKFGSTQNRLEHAIKNNENKTENLEHSDSVIRDTDMAEEMVRHANSNILEQAGISMLSQANQSKQVVLQLLG